MRAVARIVSLLLLSLPAAGETCVEDDLAQHVCVPEPARRIAALSPGATELVYAAGAGDRVVAVVEFSDYPPAAKKVASVGSHSRIDLEALLTLQPDLVVGWITGNPQEQLATIAEAGIPVFHAEPRTFDDVASLLERLGTLAGTQEGQLEARRLRVGFETLKQRYTEAAPIKVFYQVWQAPLMTVNDQHFIGQVIQLCGGVNPYGDLSRLVPRISLESVLVEDPEAIVAGGMGEENRDWLEDWRDYPQLIAVQRNNLFFVRPSLIQRPTPRLLEGSRRFCRKLDLARERR